MKNDNETTKNPLFLLSDNIKFLELVKIDKGKMEALGQQSIKITLPCGCYQVFHSLAGGTKYNHLTNSDKSPLQIEKERFFTELCNNHK